nr:putative late blight resistance protein homolog R1A-10 [Ipomoea batatas]
MEWLSMLAQSKTLIVSCSDSESQVGAPILHLPLTIWEPPQLRHLELDTSFAVNPPSMKLKLNGTNLSGSDLLVIGTLQWLEVLKLENAFHEKVWEVVEGGFYRLRLLVLKDKRLERLEAYADSFPCLEHLVLRCCECLEDISTSFGEIVCFKSIEMDRFSHRPSIVASARIIQENLKKNYGKENFETLIVSSSDSESQVGAPILHLPSTIWESPQLRHLELGASYVVNPPSMVKKNLQTLSWVGPTHCRKEVYSSFPNIKKLKIFCKEELEPNHIGGSSSKHIIFDKLDYLDRLKSLTISVSVGCIVTFPERFIFPSQLKKLKLSGTNLSGWDLTVIGSLPRLEVLKLENVFHEKVWEVAEGEFYRLRLLVLEDKKLERFEAYTNCFLCLEHLVLKCCECLEEIPSSFGEILYLQSIEMDRISHRPSIIASARDIQEKLKNFGKENFEVRRKQL